MVKLKDINWESLPEVSHEGKLNQVFMNTLKEIQSETGFNPVVSKVTIIYNGKNGEVAEEGDSIIDIGIERIEENGTLTLILFEKYKEFLPYIILREAYYCFIPPKIREIKNVKIAVNLLVETKFSKLKNSSKWRTLLREHIVDYEYIGTSAESFLGKLFSLQDFINPAQFILKYIRNVSLTKHQDTEEFVEGIHTKFILENSQILFRDDLIETLRILIKIFYEVKNYRALSDYQKYFKEFKESGSITTDLSLKKFSLNVRWIAKYRWISPNYILNLPAIGLHGMHYHIKFSPLLSVSKIMRCLEQIPFIMHIRYCLSNFSVEAKGYFLYPHYYKKDIITLFKKMEDMGYLVEHKLYHYHTTGNCLNLNYFREFYKKGRIINPYRKEYENNYEISFESGLQGPAVSPFKKLSTLEYLFLSIAPYFASMGIGFEGKSKTVKTMKRNLFNELMIRELNLRRLKRAAKELRATSNFKEEFIDFLMNNQKKGFFYIRTLLNDFYSCITLTIRHLSKNAHICNPAHLKEEILSHKTGFSFEEELLFKNPSIGKPIFNVFVPSYIKEISTYAVLKEKSEQLKKETIFYKELLYKLPLHFSRKLQIYRIRLVSINIKLAVLHKELMALEFVQMRDRYRIFSQFIQSCYTIKVFDLKVIIKLARDTSLISQIYGKKEQQLKKLRNEFKSRDITGNELDATINFLVNNDPWIIKPLLIASMVTTHFAKYYIYLVVNYAPDISKKIEILKHYFPRVTHNGCKSILDGLEIYTIQIFLPAITTKEKYILLSTIKSLFKGNGVIATRIFESGYFRGFYFKDFYDLNQQEFFYAPHLFSQYFLYMKNLLGEKIKKINKTTAEVQDLFWDNNYSLDALVSEVKKREDRKNTTFSQSKLNEISDFYGALKNHLLNTESFRAIKKADFFKQYVKSIKFEPALQKYGLGQYYLYINTPHLPDIDFKLLFNNTFQKISYPLHPTNVQSLFIKYLFPFKNPNMAYINLLALNRKMISEYCIFLVKKMHVLCHFEHNLGSEGWSLDAKNFKAFVQRNLHNPGLKIENSVIKTYTLGNIDTSTYLTPDSQEYLDLRVLYGYKQKDIKLILGTNRRNLSKSVLNLLKKDLIYPYLKLKNLDFIEKLVIILPDLTTEVITKLIRVFSFFNYGFIYEIEGQYFIQEFDKEKLFQDGLMIKVYFPSIELSHFQKEFTDLFAYLGVEKYLILTDLHEANKLIQSVYGNAEALESYNPLKNLKWNKLTKVYNNSKLFGQGVTPIYPKLIPDENK